MFKNLKRKAKLFIRPERNGFKTYLKNQQFYPTSYVEPQDIFIAGYPKSGNTWMQHMMASLIYGIEPQYLPDKLAQELVPEIKRNETYYKRFLSFTCFKIHNLPKPEYRRVIHLVRDGRDAMASYFAMQKGLGKDISLKDMIVDGKGIVPSKWHEHSKQWIENPYDAEIIQVKYEDLLQEPKREIEKICAFIGLVRSDELIDKCVKGNSFESMQEREEKYGIGNKNWNKKERFVRKGKIGTYKEEIPENLNNYFTDESRKELQYFGYID